MVTGEFGGESVSYGSGGKEGDLPGAGEPFSAQASERRGSGSRRWGLQVVYGPGVRIVFYARR